MYIYCLGKPNERWLLITETLLTFPFKYFIVIAERGSGHVQNRVL